MATKLYKNWAEICKIDNELLLYLLATLDMDSKYADSLVAAFPDCFTKKKNNGQVPYSVIKAEYDRQLHHISNGDWVACLERVLDSFSVPHKEFDIEEGHEGTLLPKDAGHKFGDEFKWLGQKMVIISIDHNLFPITVPASRVNLER